MKGHRAITVTGNRVFSKQELSPPYFANTDVETSALIYILIV